MSRCSNSQYMSGGHSEPNPRGKCTWCGNKIAKSEDEIYAQPTKPKNIDRMGQRPSPLDNVAGGFCLISLFMIPFVLPFAIGKAIWKKFRG